MASADTMVTVSKALFRDVSICRTLGKFPSWALRRHSIGARDESHGHAISHILRPDFDAWNNNTTNAYSEMLPPGQREQRLIPTGIWRRDITNWGCIGSTVGGVAGVRAARRRHG
jgi:hypothetical protein